MTGRFSVAERQQFERDGFLCPIDLFDAAEIADYNRELECAESLLVAAGCQPPHKQLHLSFPWAYDLATHPKILDLIEDLIGPDILIFNSTVFAKPPRSRSYVPWHQDSHYLLQDQPRLVAVWIALTPSTSHSGCMRVVPGSHQLGRLPHVSRKHADNMLDFAGLVVDHDVDDTRAVEFMIQPGQASVHHANTIHSSNPNHSDHWRIGYVIRYMSPDVQVSQPWYGAVLARGRDGHGHYRLLDRPASSDLEASVAGQIAYRAWLSTAISANARVLEQS